MNSKTLLLKDLAKLASKALTLILAAKGRVNADRGTPEPSRTHGPDVNNVLRASSSPGGRIDNRLDRDLLQLGNMCSTTN